VFTGDDDVGTQESTFQEIVSEKMAASSGDAVVEVDKQGFLGYVNSGDKKFAKKPKNMWFTLIQGSLFVYKTPLDAAPVFTHAINGATIASLADEKSKSKSTKGNFGLTVKSAGSDALVTLTAINAEDRDNWVTELNAATSKAAVEAPEKTATKRQRGGLMFRAKKSVASKAGNGMVKRLADDDTKALLAALRKVIGKHQSEKRASEIESSIMKIAIKSYLLVDNKSIVGSEFLKVDGPLRAAFELTAKIFDKASRANDQALMDACQRVEVLYSDCEKVLETLLLPHVKPATILRLKDVFTTISSPRFLFAIFRDESLEEEVHDLVKAMEYYTQFHYHQD
jgi:hypothetical protein